MAGNFSIQNTKYSTTVWKSFGKTLWIILINIGKFQDYN